MHSLRREDLGFLERAPKRWNFEAPLDAPPDAVFAAISAEPSTWRSWFPGLTSGHYEADGTPGVGTVREVKVGRNTYRETIIAWEAPKRWVYRVDEMTPPLAKALIEEWAIMPTAGGSVVRWTFAIDPRPLFVISLPFAPRVMGRLFRRAMRNLDALLAGG